MAESITGEKQKPAEIVMTKDRDRFDKVIAIALNPGAYEEEAITALRKARELVRVDPELAHPPSPATSPPEPPPPVEHSLAFQVTKIPPYWINIFTNNVSEAAYGLGLKSKVVVELEKTPHVIQIRCDGHKQACAVFEAHLNWLITYINTQPPKG